MSFFYLSEEFNCNTLFSNNVHSVRYRPNCKPLRETKITEVDYLGRYQIGSKCKGSEEKAGIYFHSISAIQMNVSTSVPKKRDDSRFKLSRLLILDSLLSCSRIQILAKKQNRFWIHEFPPKTYPGKYLNQCLQYIVILTTGSIVFCLEIID